MPFLPASPSLPAVELLELEEDGPERLELGSDGVPGRPGELAPGSEGMLEAEPPEEEGEGSDELDAVEPPLLGIDGPELPDDEVDGEEEGEEDDDPDGDDEPELLDELCCCSRQPDSTRLSSTPSVSGNRGLRVTEAA